jgi:hypothetical protein
MATRKRTLAAPSPRPFMKLCFSPDAKRLGVRHVLTNLPNILMCFDGDVVLG